MCPCITCSSRTLDEFIVLGGLQSGPIPECKFGWNGGDGTSS